MAEAGRPIASTLRARIDEFPVGWTRTCRPATPAAAKACGIAPQQQALAAVVLRGLGVDAFAIQDVLASHLMPTSPSCET
ncbi:MAG: hypothetical protein K2X52_17950 [Mycobacteriaceae bacterium]|nr:hypothetical protein [Mycobacteriaceae bacterium]